MYKLIDWVQFPVGSYQRLETVLAVCPASCSALMWGCKDNSCMVLHWLTASIAFIAKAAVWPMLRLSRDGCIRPLTTLQKEYETECNETDLNTTIN